MSTVSQSIAIAKELENVQPDDIVESLAFAIDHENPSLWPNIVARATEHIKCHDGCYKDAATSQDNDANQCPEAQQPNSTNSQIAPRRLTPPWQSKLKRDQKIFLLDLPIEVFIIIAEMVVGGPYIVQATLCSEYNLDFPGRPMMLAFRPPRSWKSIQILHVCKAFRNAAIKLYGTPHPSSIPFNPARDKLVISDLTDLGGINDIVKRRVWRRGVKADNQPLITGNRKRCYNMELNLPGAVTKQFWLRPFFFDRITKIEITATAKPLPSRVVTTRDAWAGAFMYLSKLLPNLKTVGISVRNLDDCVKDPDEQPPESYLKAEDYLLLEGLQLAAEETAKVPDPKSMFPNLERWVVTKLGHYCSSGRRPIPGGDTILALLMVYNFKETWFIGGQEVGEGITDASSTDA
ncbi:hypothetical protein F5Y13DRAFT_202995 [Hypoxylon sp. FL1857]|nr:hypothetical protein F5Y13DRAFT_202995 [Hypoxylon sp. FL1857]